MKLVNANMAGITPAMAMYCVGEAGHSIEVHAPPAQIIAWQRQALYANGIEFEPDKFPDIRSTKLTLAGIPLVSDPEMCEHWVEFRDAEGNTLLRIENLAIPCLT